MSGDGEVRLRDLKLGELRSFRRFSAVTRHWQEVGWASCPDCGVSPVCPCETDGGTYDGEPLVCLECGEVGSVFADERGCSEVWSEDEDGCKLRPSALAGLRRLLGEPRSSWWDGLCGDG